MTELFSEDNPEILRFNGFSRPFSSDFMCANKKEGAPKVIPAIILSI